MLFSMGAPESVCEVFLKRFDEDALEFDIILCVKYFNEKNLKNARKMFNQIDLKTDYFIMGLAESIQADKIPDAYQLNSLEHVLAALDIVEPLMSFEFIDWCISLRLS